MSSRILVLDDDARIRRLLGAFLTEEGFQVQLAENIGAARQAIRDRPPDIALVDLNLGGENGLTFAHELSESERPGVIIVSGKTSPVDRVVGLEIGADDYITKPFDLRELLARIRAVMRRMPPSGSGGAVLATDSNGARYAFADWQFDTGRRDLTHADGRVVRLTGAEFKLLSAFVARPNKVLSRDQLMDIVAGREWAPFDRAIDTQIKRLRAKLGESGRRPTLIRAVRGTGYVFAYPVRKA